MNPEDVLFAQYKECWREISHYDTLIWQTPTVTLAIISFFAIAYLGYASNISERLLLTLGVIIVTLAQLHALTKHRFFQEIRNRDFAQLQSRLLERIEETSRYPIKWRTKELLGDPNRKAIYSDVETCPRWWYNRSSYNILRVVLLAFVLFEFVLLEYHILQLLHLVPIS